MAATTTADRERILRAAHDRLIGRFLLLYQEKGGEPVGPLLSWKQLTINSACDRADELMDELDKAFGKLFNLRLDSYSRRTSSLRIARACRLGLRTARSRPE